MIHFIEQNKKEKNILIKVLNFSRKLRVAEWCCDLWGEFSNILEIKVSPLQVHFPPSKSGCGGISERCNCQKWMSFNLLLSSLSLTQLESQIGRPDQSKDYPFIDHWLHAVLQSVTRECLDVAELWTGYSIIKADIVLLCRQCCKCHPGDHWSQSRLVKWKCEENVKVRPSETNDRVPSDGGQSANERPGMWWSSQSEGLVSWLTATLDHLAKLSAG